MPTHPISLSHLLYGALHAFPHMLQLLAVLMLRHEPVSEQRAYPFLLHPNPITPPLAVMSDAMCVLFNPNKKASRRFLPPQLNRFRNEFLTHKGCDLYLNAVKFVMVRPKATN